MLSKALREYDTVSAEPSTEGASAVLFEPGTNRAAVDVRRFPWIRPLSGDYAYDFERSRAARTPAIRRRGRRGRAIARARAGPRAKAPRRLAEVIAAQQERRNAPPAARAAAARLAARRHRRGRHRSAGRSVRRSDVHAAEGDDRDPAGAARRREDTGSRSCRSSGSMPRITTGTEIASCTVLDAHFQPRTVALAPPDGAGELPVGALTLDAASSGTIDELVAALASTEFTDAFIAGLRAAYHPGSGRRVRVRHVDRGSPGSRTAWSCSSLPIRRRSRSSPTCSRASCGTRAGRRRSRPMRATRWPRWATRRRSIRSPTAVALFHLDGARPPIRRSGDGFVVGEAPLSRGHCSSSRPSNPRALQPERAAAPDRPGHAVPDHLLRGRPERAGLPRPAARRLRAFGVPMPLDLLRAQRRRSSTPPRRGSCAATPCTSRTLQPQDESALNRLLESQLPQSVEQAMREAGEAVRRAAWTRVIEALPALDPTLAGAARTTLGKMEHDLRGAAHQDDPGGEAARRNAAPPVRPRPVAGLPARPSPGAHPLGRVSS